MRCGARRLRTGPAQAPPAIIHPPQLARLRASQQFGPLQRHLRNVCGRSFEYVTRQLRGRSERAREDTKMTKQVACFLAYAVMSTSSPALAGDLPNPAITPGLADPALTKDVLCAPGFSTRSIRNVPSARKKAIYKVYGMVSDTPPCPCEIDHLIPLSLGGSNRPRNLWPQSDSTFPWFA
jgi:hypothetical protein